MSLKGGEPMNNRKVVIIGGGIAGLCTGVYLRKCGFDPEILEMHSIAGGLATAWKKGGFTFENCIDWLLGSKEGGSLNASWKEVFDLGRLKFHEGPVYQVLERGSETITIYRDPDRLEGELLSKAPEDEAAVKELVRLIKKLAKFRFPEGDTFLANLAGFVRMVPFLPTLSKYRKDTAADFSQRFKNPLLRDFFAAGISDLSFLALAFFLGWMAGGNAGYPIGGSLKFIGLIQENYERLGGRIRFKARVERILVEDGRAVGVALADGERILADIVVSAADGHATIFELLEGKYADDKIKRIYATYKPFPSYLQVSLGVGADLCGEPGFLQIAIDKKIPIDPQTAIDAVSFRVFNFDPTFAPAGKTAVVTFIATYNYAYWRDLRATDRAHYDAEKRRVAGEVIAVFERRFPKAKGKIEVVDVATPATVIRYTGNWRGSMEGWLVTPATGVKLLPSVLPGLRNFYMAGHWVSPGGGLPSGLLTGRMVARRIAKDNGVPWRPS
jgi:phytoene dehydrogenase-like protein